jgi:hypothetical protein
MDTDMLCLSSSLQLLFIDRGLGRGEKYTKDEFFISGIGFLGTFHIQERFRE